MAVTRDEVIWAYAYFLNRAPESEEVIQGQMNHYSDLHHLRSEFSKSSDFKALVRQPENCFIAPFLLPEEIDGVITIDVPVLETPQSQMCTRRQMQEPFYASFCRDIGLDPDEAHRKHWEWAYICSALKSAGVIQPGKKGLVFAVGRERLPAYFASHGVDILATDGPSDVVDMWTQSDQYSQEVDNLCYPEITTPEKVKQHVTFRTVDMLDIPADLAGFDFLWSSCSMEHLGGITPGIEFVKNAMRCLKPGGIAVHTTEFNLSSDTDTLDCAPTCIYRRQDMERMAAELERLGHHVRPLNFFPGTDPLDVYIDYPPHAPPHLKIALDRFVTTSIGIIVQKQS